MVTICEAGILCKFPRAVNTVSHYFTIWSMKFIRHQQKNPMAWNITINGQLDALLHEPLAELATSYVRVPSFYYTTPRGQFFSIFNYDFVIRLAIPYEPYECINVNFYCRLAVDRTFFFLNIHTDLHHHNWLKPLNGLKRTKMDQTISQNHSINTIKTSVQFCNV